MQIASFNLGQPSPYRLKSKEKMVTSNNQLMPSNPNMDEIIITKHWMKAITIWGLAFPAVLWPKKCGFHFTCSFHKQQDRLLNLIHMGVVAIRNLALRNISNYFKWWNLFQILQCFHKSYLSNMTSYVFFCRQRHLILSLGHLGEITIKKSCALHITYW